MVDLCGEADGGRLERVVYRKFEVEIECSALK